MMLVSIGSAVFVFTRQKKWGRIIIARTITAQAKATVDDELAPHYRLPVDSIVAPDDQA